MTLAVNFLSKHGFQIDASNTNLQEAAAGIGGFVIAALSFVPGGVTIFGMHWETKLEGPEMGAAETFRFHYGPMELAINLQEAQNGLRKSFVLVKAGRDKKFTTMNMIPLTGNDDQDARRSAETTMWDLCEAYFEPEAARFSISMADVDAETRQAMSWEVERYINNSQQFIGFIDEACRTLQTTSN